MKTWKQIALQYHVLLNETKSIVEKEAKVGNVDAERVAIRINQTLAENIPSIRRLNESK